MWVGDANLEYKIHQPYICNNLHLILTTETHVKLVKVEDVCFSGSLCEFSTTKYL